MGVFILFGVVWVKRFFYQLFNFFTRGRQSWRAMVRTLLMLLRVGFRTGCLARCKLN